VCFYRFILWQMLILPAENNAPGRNELSYLPVSILHFCFCVAGFQVVVALWYQVHNVVAIPQTLSRGSHADFLIF